MARWHSCSPRGQRMSWQSRSMPAWARSRGEGIADDQVVQGALFRVQAVLCDLRDSPPLLPGEKRGALRGSQDERHLLPAGHHEPRSFGDRAAMGEAPGVAAAAVAPLRPVRDSPLPPVLSPLPHGENLLPPPLPLPLLCPPCPPCRGCPPLLPLV